MIPGLVSKVSEKEIALAASIVADHDVLVVSDTTAGTTFSTIQTKAGIPQQFLMIVNGSGAAIAATTTGNISGAHTFPDAELALMVFSRITGKWHVNVSA